MRFIGVEGTRGWGRGWRGRTRRVPGSPRLLTCGREKAILPGEVRLRTPLLQVPAVGLAQAILERRQLEAEIGTHAINTHGDRRNVEINTEVVRRREQHTA